MRAVPHQGAEHAQLEPGEPSGTGPVAGAVDSGERPQEVEEVLPARAVEIFSMYLRTIGTALSIRPRLPRNRGNAVTPTIGIVPDMNGEKSASPICTCASPVIFTTSVGLKGAHRRTVR